MKNVKILFLFCAVALLSCTRQITPETIVEPPPPPIDTTVTAVKYIGTFQNGPYGITSGTTRVVVTNGKLQLRLKGFKVSSGPDLKVYVSRELQPLNFLRLGSLKALSGDQLYDIPGNPNFMEYSFVLIHCEKFNHLFGSAVLMKQ